MTFYGKFLLEAILIQKYDFNSEITESAMEDFCETYHLHDLVKDLRCFKNPDKPSCMELILTNFPESFVKLETSETSEMVGHKLILYCKK